MENKILNTTFLFFLYVVLGVVIGFASHVGGTSPELIWQITVILTLVAKLLLDLRVFGIGIYMFICLLLFMPLWVLCVFWPLGLVIPFETNLIRDNFNSLVFMYLYTSVIFSMIGLFRKEGIRQWEMSAISEVINSIEQRKRRSILEQTVYVLIVLASAVIARPQLPFTTTYGQEQVASLLPGNAWVLVGSIACFFLVTRIDLISSKLTLIVFLMWIVGSYSRVEIIGIVVFTTLLVSTKTSKKVLIAMAAAIMAGFGVIGGIRSGGVFDAREILNIAVIQIFNNDTAQNIVYGSAAYMEYTDRFGHSFTVPDLLLKTFLPSFLTEGIRFSSLVVEESVHFNWGSFFANEFYLNGGYLGVLFAPFALYIVTIFLARRFLRNRILGASLMYYSLIVIVSRVTWYEPLLFLKFSLYLCVPFWILSIILSKGDSTLRLNSN